LKMSSEVINEILAEREVNYGEYDEVASISQDIKIALNSNWGDRPAYMNESLDMIANKLARIVNGDPFYKESWVDIIGYVQLVVNRL